MGTLWLNLTKDMLQPDVHNPCTCHVLSFVQIIIGWVLFIVLGIKFHSAICFFGVEFSISSTALLPYWVTQQYHTHLLVEGSSYITHSSDVRVQLSELWYKSDPHLVWWADFDSKLEGPCAPAMGDCLWSSTVVVVFSYRSMPTALSYCMWKIQGSYTRDSTQAQHRIFAQASSQANTTTLVWKTSWVETIPQLLVKKPVKSTQVHMIKA